MRSINVYFFIRSFFTFIATVVCLLQVAMLLYSFAMSDKWAIMTVNKDEDAMMLPEMMICNSNPINRSLAVEIGINDVYLTRLIRNSSLWTEWMAYLKAFKEIAEVRSKKGGAKKGNEKTPEKRQQTLDTLVKPPPTQDNGASASESKITTSGSDSEEKPKKTAVDETTADNSWFQFCKLCDNIANVSSYLKKTEVIKRYLTKGSSGDGFKGDTYIILKMLLPNVVKRVYNINSKQIIKRFSEILGESADAMSDHLDNSGEVSNTVQTYFEKSSRISPQSKSTLNIFEVDAWLQKMTNLTKDNEQQNHLEKILKKCTSDDILYIIRQLKHDIRINSGAKHVLEALDPNAYSAFQASRDLASVVKRVKAQKTGGSKLNVGISLMVPVLPMLAEACKSVEMAMRKCPNGMFAEVKYDGERLQVHKQGNQFNYYSRSLKAVMPHKVQFIKEFLPKAFPEGTDLIIDAEVLLVSHETKQPLPFGTLSKHKNNAFKNANVALFVFDCLFYNGRSLMNESVKIRKEVLKKHMKEIDLRIMFSQAEHVTDARRLKVLINKAISEGLEGLVLKDLESKYEPGKRHWLKVKKDYLKDGTMADSADLIVLGAYYGTGSKGGMMSVFLMGVYDPKSKGYKTVTKVGNGHDDSTLDKVNKGLKDHVVKISKDYGKVPSWLDVSRTLVPDFVVSDPKLAPIWEISGAEFSKSESHSAGGISIRFPRVTKIRDDKSWDTATNLDELKKLFETSKQNTDALAGLSLESDFDLDNEPNLGDIDKDDDEDDDFDSEYEKEKSSDSDSDEKPVSTALSSGDKNSPNKRQFDNSDGGENTTSKKSKIACKYGGKCYQKGKQHQLDFWHPGDDVDESDNDQDDDEKELFTDVKFYLSDDVPNLRIVQRYIAMNDGELVDDVSLEHATHVIVGNMNSKNNAFKNANVALFVFDCLFYNGRSLMNESVKTRKDVLKKHMKEIDLRIMFSQAEHVTDARRLKVLINKAISEGLEGLVLKDLESKYEPGKRHWLKVKKDYLKDGTMADSADLIVLGAYYGTGSKGGMMSVFLMGVYDPKSKGYKTVTKVGNGHDDSTLDKVNKGLKDHVVKISKDYAKVPSWLDVSRTLVPDFVVSDPKLAPIWEISGAEFSKSESHSAGGISIRFPRVTKIRDDKSWDTATNLDELKKLFETSKQNTDALAGLSLESDFDLDNEPNLGDINKDDNNEDDDFDSDYEKEKSSDSDSDKKPVSTALSSGDKNSPNKRQFDNSDGSENTTSKKSKIACKYGGKCYQKGKQHQLDFWHPGDDVDKSDNDQDDDEKELFTDVKFYLSDDVPNLRIVQRYIAMNDGELVDDVSLEQATHFIVGNMNSKIPEGCPESAKILITEWVLQCVKQKKIIGSSKYKIER